MEAATVARKAGKILAILLVVYVCIVAAFESLLGYFQPENQATLKITTFENGEAFQRVLARLESDGATYVAVNHWPRAWYHRALDNPGVEVTFDGTTGAHTAVPVTGAEHDRVNADNPLGPFFRVLTGFPPRYFLRLEPRG